MRKNSRTRKTCQGTQTHRNSKVQRKKMRQQKQQIKRKEVGKPRNLKSIKLDKPEIWSTSKQIVSFLSFLIQNGRHISIHLAGAKRNSKNEIKRKKKEELYIQIKKNQPLFEFLELFSIKNLGLPQKNQKKTRIVVFFFRDQDQPIQKYVKNNELKNKVWIKILKQMYFFLDQKFYNELINILIQIENNQSFEQIINSEIDNFYAKNNLEDIQVIFKNLLIEIIKTGKDYDLNMNNLINSSSKEILEIYKRRIHSYQNELINFISQLICLITEQNINQLQDIQYSNTEGNNDSDLEQEDNYFEQVYINSNSNQFV